MFEKARFAYFIECIKQELNEASSPRDGSPTLRARTSWPQNTRPKLDVAFGSMLKYIDIPVQCDSADQCSFGGSHAREILEWLATCKSVRKVLDVRIEDCRHYFHTEEDIELCLKPFDVKNLDWYRVDLSIDTITQAAPNVSSLHLYSSGGLAAIDHWVGPNGVRMLKKESHTALSKRSSHR